MSQHNSSIADLSYEHQQVVEAMKSQLLIYEVRTSVIGVVSALAADLIDSAGGGNG